MAKHLAEQGHPQREHDRAMQAARLADAQNAREHQTLRAALPTPPARPRAWKPRVPKRAL
ncbi:hypothetical protein [Kitasatospora indigofera]|uniref:hypothetical protein n=1 Tax=Kitasatospora indigofera TaxID=67307 RepID=UPI0036BF4949